MNTAAILILVPSFATLSFLVGGILKRIGCCLRAQCHAW
jgi:hypothetical protein